MPARRWPATSSPKSPARRQWATSRHLGEQRHHVGFGHPPHPAEPGHVAEHAVIQPPHHLRPGHPQQRRRVRRRHEPRRAGAQRPASSAVGDGGLVDTVGRLAN